MIRQVGKRPSDLLAAGETGLVVAAGLDIMGLPIADCRLPIAESRLPRKEIKRSTAGAPGSIGNRQSPIAILQLVFELCLTVFLVSLTIHLNEVMEYHILFSEIDELDAVHARNYSLSFDEP